MYFNESFVKEYKNIALFTLDIKNNKPTGLYYRDTEHESPNDWNGNVNFSEAVNLANRGYSEPLQKIRDTVNNFKIEYVVSEKKRITKKSYFSNRFSVPLVVAQANKFCIATKYISLPVKNITLNYNINGGSYLSSEDMENAGTCMCILVNYLEKKGYKVKLNVMQTSCGEGKFAGYKVSIKDFHQPLNIQGITYPLCHSSMLRRLGFMWLERRPQFELSSYGHSLWWESGEDYNKVMQLAKETKLIQNNEYIVFPQTCMKCEYDAKLLWDFLKQY